MANQKHLTLSDRIFIEKALGNGASRKSIVDTLNKDKSTICKEIKKHAKLIPFGRIGTTRKGTYDCAKISECRYKTYCPKVCEKCIPVPCKRKDSPSGVCNGCDKYSSCKLTKKMYIAEDADDEYRAELVESREGWDLTTREAKFLAETIKPLLKQGQSIDFILRSHPELDYSEKTIYNYIDQGALSQFGVSNIDLRRKVSRKMTREKKKEYKKREDKKYLKGRTHRDFLNYIAEHPDLPVVEMDTVYNDVSDGPFVQTFQFVEQELMIFVYHDTKTADDMYGGIKYIHDKLGHKTFKKMMPVILTDRGTEFACAEKIESLGCRIFYCDAMASWQKPHVENNHILFRYVCPKKTDFRKLGLVSQDKMDLVMSHVNSYGRESLHGRSPYETFEFFHPESHILDALNIKKIAPDDITLTPELFKK